MTHSDRPSLVVCVQNPDTCERLLQHGADLAKQNNWDMEVLSIQPRPRRGRPYPVEQIEQLHSACRKAGVQMTVYYGDSPAPLAVEYLQSSLAVHLVLGTAPDQKKDSFSKGFIKDLHSALPAIPMTLVDTDNTVYHLSAAPLNQCIPAALYARI